MRDLGRATRVAAGAIGEPGDRTFFLEVDAPGGPFWFIMEKLQVAALALQVRELLQGRREDEAEYTGGIADDPVPAFRVTEVRISDAGPDGYRVDLYPIDSPDTQAATFVASAEVLAAMTAPALTAVDAGRPRCPRCGLAMDPDGHPCPAGNGDLRNHRP